MGSALEGGEGAELDTGGGGLWSKTPRRGLRIYELANGSV